MHEFMCLTHALIDANNHDSGDEQTRPGPEDGTMDNREVEGTNITRNDKCHQRVSCCKYIMYKFIT